MSTTSTVLWLRHDLRPFDHPALEAAQQETAEAPNRGDLHRVFVYPRTVSPFRAQLLDETLAELQEHLGPIDVIRKDEHPGASAADLIANYVEDLPAPTTVYVSADYTPLGLRRDKETEQALRKLNEDNDLVAVGDPYTVTPGTLATTTGGHYKVFTSFYKAWLEPAELAAAATTLPDEKHQQWTAWDKWEAFRTERLDGYRTQRDRPDKPATSQISAYLAIGALHPRTLIRSLQPDVRGNDSARAADAAAFIRELAFREFYGDFVYHQPNSMWEDVNPRFEHFNWDQPDGRFRAWQEGRTGYPIVDAGMRQLAETGWMHNRVRMIVASFLTKDLHMPWQVGAKHFADVLVDFDPAINQHSWQWCAGTGTDASPYFRVFNPMTQGEKFDPDARYIKRWVPELELCSAKDIHKMRQLPADYPAPIVDHAEERLEALARYEEVKG